MPTTRIRLHSIRVPYGASDDAVRAAAALKLSISPDRLPPLATVRRSIDTRSKPRIFSVLALEFDADPALIKGLPQNEASMVAPLHYAAAAPGVQPMQFPPIVVGAGPAGLFAALTLAESGYAPLVVERGPDVDRRDRDVAAALHGSPHNPESNLLFGEGGAGAYSDGKLTTRINDPLTRHVLQVLRDCGAPPAILIDARPHIGSDVLPTVVKNLRHRIESAGGCFEFSLRVSNLAMNASGDAIGVNAFGRGLIPAAAVLLAPGNSAADLFSALSMQSVAFEQKPFQVGLRIEHPQDFIDRAVYSRPRGDLPPAEYIHSSRPSARSRAVATFCMCPGGTIVPVVSTPRHLSTNGQSHSSRSGKFANCALVVTVNPSDLPSGAPLAGLVFQRSLERAAFEVAADYRAPAQRAKDFIRRRKGRYIPPGSYPLGLVPADLALLLPEFVSDSLRAALSHFDRIMPGFINEGLLVGVETRVSSPLRMVRDRDSRQSTSTPNLYPAGEGSGYSGGITSSAVDGIRTAEAVISRFKPLSQT